MSNLRPYFLTEVCLLLICLVTGVHLSVCDLRSQACPCWKFSHRHQILKLQPIMTVRSLPVLHSLWPLAGHHQAPTRDYITGRTSLYGMLLYSLTVCPWASILLSIIAKWDLQFQEAWGGREGCAGASSALQSDSSRGLPAVQLGTR